MDLSGVRWEIVVVFVLAFFDMTMTYLLLSKSQQMGDKNWYKNEQNGVIQFFFRKYGLHKGARLGSLFTFSMLMGLFVYLSLRVNWVDFTRFTFFLMGAYVIILTYHMLYFRHFNEEAKKMKNEAKK